MLNKKGDLKMKLTKLQIDSLSDNTKIQLLSVLYLIEDELQYEYKDISRTINYLQDLERSEQDA